ncbi:MAG TPA: hypothetical protein PKY59_08710 [Pyrinomonadaceae bacterium]|nr:hypothetical protein [Pyrinomonadaceae bacterium]
MKHIEFEKLLEEIEGSFRQKKTSDSAEHLAVCGECSRQAAKLKRFFNYTEDTRHEEALSQALTARLLNIYQAQKFAVKVKKEKESLTKKLFAILAFDDWQTALNERLTFTDSRQLLYKADKYDIDLRLNFVGDKCQLSGQILPDCEISEIQLVSGSNTETADLPKNCEFSFPLIEQKVYKLLIKLKDKSIEIKEISLLI